MGNPHVLVIPYPAQGHVFPLMEFALCLVQYGIRVTFVNTDFTQERVIKSLSDAEKVPELMNLVSIPDGLEFCEDRSDLGKLMKSIYQVMPGKLEALIDNINGSGDDKITCLIADENLGWTFDLAEKMGIRGIAFWPSSAATMAVMFSIQTLIDDGIIDRRTGSLLKDHKVQLSPGMPAMDPAHFSWLCIDDESLKKMIYDAMGKNNRAVKKADWVICNTTEVLEGPTLNSFPEILPIGPLLASNRLGKALGSFWSEDSDCMTWLDKQPPQSVIYVAFGSLTVFDKTQFHELALGLELTNMPFLWVVRPDLTEEIDNAYPTGFRSRILGRGRIVSWAPQQDVLKHPSVACFLSHCGWNSTMEGVSNGVPYLCWPYFADQFFDQSYICDIWKVGLGFDRNKNGIIERTEIKNKIDQLLGDENFRARALELQARIMNSVKEDGSSRKNLCQLINWIYKVQKN